MRLMRYITMALVAVMTVITRPLAASNAGEVTSLWHGGPFFEYGRTVGPDPAGGTREERLSTFWAFRPLYAQVHTPNTARYDVLWPIFTTHRTGDRAWWRACFLAYGDARSDTEDTWSFMLFPLCFAGRDRQTGNYGGLFPIYGEHPHFLLMDDWRFVLWPLWMDYSVKGMDHGAVLWPLITWKDNDAASFGVWPLYSHARLRESDHWYALWPIVTWARYDEDRDTGGAGYSWMFWPLYGMVARVRETQHLVVPPFFSYARTPETLRWRLPWPLVDVEIGTRRIRTSVWPLYEYLDGFDYAARTPRTKGERLRPQERTRRYLWKLVEDTTLETANTRLDRFLFFPFWTSERRYTKGKDGVWRRSASYTRLWPFWSATTENGCCQQRALELIPVRHAEGFDRNWAPFWTFWSATSLEGGVTDHVFLWHLFTFSSEN